MNTNSTSPTFDLASVRHLITNGFAAKLQRVLIGATVWAADQANIQVTWTEAGTEYFCYIHVLVNGDGTATATVLRHYEGAETLVEWICATGTQVELSC